MRSKASIKGHALQCPWHGSQFDVNTGTCKAGPAKESINTYTVTEKDGKVYVKI